jgi:hypothetical protein
MIILDCGAYARRVDKELDTLETVEASGNVQGGVAIVITQSVVTAEGGLKVLHHLYLIEECRIVLCCSSGAVGVIRRNISY